MSAAVFGREEELGSIHAFLEQIQRGPATLVLEGEPGIGKTILWQAGVEHARRLFDCILSYRGVEAEATLAFAALCDLLEDVVEEGLPLLAPPRRRALEVALLLEKPGGEPPDPHAIALGFLDILRRIADSGPVLIAVDDLQWVDPSSLRVILAALRRLQGDRVGLLATSRMAPDEEPPFEIDRALPEDRVRRLSVKPLSLGALYRLLEERLGLELTRPELVRVGEVTGGNPFFAIELGRELMQTKRRLAAGRPLPVPGNLKRLLGARLARLSTETREVLLTAAAQSRPTVEALSAVHGIAASVTETLDEAARAGVVELEGSRIRFAHPLLAAVCYEEAHVWKRRAAHRRLAATIGDVEERARHLALATDGPDEYVASALDDAAVRAAARGATAAAAELSELASDLTPADDAGEHRRRLQAAEFHRLAGDRGRAARILEKLLPEAESGAERADILFSLARVQRTDLPGVIELCRQALEEDKDDDARCARILTYLSWVRMLEADIRPALADARAGLERAERVGDPTLVARAIARVAMSETWTLDETPGLLERGVEIEERLGRGLEIHASPKWTLARRLMCADDFDQARILIEEAEANALAHGDEGTRGLILFFLGWLEFMAGHSERGLHHLETVVDLAEQLHDEQLRSMTGSAQAGVDILLGRVPEARAAIERALAISEGVSDTLIRIGQLGSAGFLELSLGNFSAADKYLRPLPAQVMALGWDHPLVSSCWQDSVEVLIALGELEAARAYLDAYEDRAQRSGAPSARAIAARCRGLLSAAEGDLPAAHSAFARALAEHDRGARPFELGRTLLALGSVRRRSKQKRAAREAIEQGLAIFEDLGARLWVDRARDELTRIAGRPPSSTELTEAEDRVAALVAEGLSNKEVASALFVSVHTVEAHLSRVYRKLGIRSRAELAHRLPAKV
jgi:DNA-binding CsgD family transcriptional regulator